MALESRKVEKYAWLKERENVLGKRFCKIETLITRSEKRILFQVLSDFVIEFVKLNETAVQQKRIMRVRSICPIKSQEIRFLYRV